MKIEGSHGEIHLTIEIKRAKTGEIETHNLVGRIEENGGNALICGS